MGKFEAKIEELYNEKNEEKANAGFEEVLKDANSLLDLIELAKDLDNVSKKVKEARRCECKLEIKAEITGEGNAVKIHNSIKGFTKKQSIEILETVLDTLKNDEKYQ